MSENNESSADGRTISDGATSSTTPLPPVSITIKTEVKIEEVEYQVPDDNAIFEPKIEMEVGASPSDQMVMCPKNEPGAEEPLMKQIDIFTILPENAIRPRSYPESVVELSCELCGRIFNRGSSLTLHMKTHRSHPNGNFTCNQCNRTFAYKISLIRHFNASKPCVVINTVFCPLAECRREFRTEMRMRRHFNEQHTNRPFTCDKCGKAFKDKDLLSAHIVRHGGDDVEKKFACSVCDKRFALVYPLEAHMRSHTKERPFQCSECMRGFSYKHNMMRHMMRHNKKLHLKCEVCHKVFPRESRLKYHMRVHWPDKKPFKCGCCHKTYSHQQNILRHYKKKHPDTEYIAPITDAEFANKAWEKRMAMGGMEKSEYILPEMMESNETESKVTAEHETVNVVPEIVMIDDPVKLEYT